ncbi:hypothetical protein ACOSP7_007951 [Xanthoceras sorbifolium]
MAPRKRTAVGLAVKPDTTAPVNMRVTRSASRRAGTINSELAKAEPPVKKAKATKRNVKKTEGEEEEEVKDEVEVEVEAPEVEKSTEDETDGSESKTKTVVIEHCKQCSSFKTRANMVKDALEKAAPEVTVLVNPEKPRRGCFEIREEGGETFISLRDMKRPFKPMKDLEMALVISEIIDKLK